MAYGELSLPPERRERNASNGRFLKGITPHNKGKGWDEWMDGRKQRKVRRIARENLKKFRPSKRPDTSERCSKAIIAIKDDGTWTWFKNAPEAASHLGGNRRNVSRCCLWNQQRRRDGRSGKINTDYRYMGIRLYFEEDSIWTSKIK